MKYCKTCNIELINPKRIYCSNPCKFADKTYNQSRISNQKNNSYNRLECKECSWITKDCLNKGGHVKVHMKSHGLIFDVNTFMDYFKLLVLQPSGFWQCSIGDCKWKTLDKDNTSGCITNHVENDHAIMEYSPEWYTLMKDIPSKKKRINSKKEFIESNPEYGIRCEECSRILEKITISHLNIHGMTFNDYKSKYNPDTTISERIQSKQRDISFNRQLGQVFSRIESFNVTPLFTKEEYTETDQGTKLYNFKCNICKNVFEANLWGRSMICRVCNPQILLTPNKKLENEFYQFLNDDCDIHDLISADRLVIRPKEIDFYIPSKNLGIELNGLFWHGSTYKDSNYHINKTMLMDEKNVQCIHIFEDEWNNKQAIIKHIIKYRINVPMKYIINPDKCTIKSVNSNDLIPFFNENSIKGYTNAEYAISIYSDNEECLAAMIFGKIINNEIELIDFSIKIDHRIDNVFHKLLHFAKTTLNCKSIKHYADIRFINLHNNVFTESGFSFLSKIPPDYYWCKSNRREHRTSFTIDKLIKMNYDSTNDLENFLIGNDYYKIYDCGYLEYEYKKL